MDDEIRRVLGGTAEQPVLTFERRYRTDPADLWQAITDPDRLARWFGRLDPVPAGVGSTFGADLGGGEADHATGVVTACRPPELLAYDWSWQGEPTSQVEAVLVADDDGTRLLLTHRLRERRNAVGYGGGWEEMLAVLADALVAAPEALEQGPASDDSAGAVEAGGVEAEAVRSWTRLFELAGPDHELRIQRTLPADPGTVWQALTTETGLAPWWWTSLETSYAVDLRRGGHYRFAAAAGGFAVTGTYLEIETEKHVAFTWVWQDSAGSGPTDRVDVTLRPGEDPGTTVLEVLHRGPWEETAQAKDYRLGWTSTLDALEQVLTA